MISKDPYMLKAEWMIKAGEEEILTFFRNRLVYSKYMGLPVDEARGEKSEDFLIWVYQHEDQRFKEKFASGLAKLMNELFEQVRQGHKDRLDPLSGVLHIVSQCRIVEAAKLLQENLIESGRLSQFANNLHHVEGKYTVCMLHQALLTLTVLESVIDKPLGRVLTRPFWEAILENDNFKDFRGLAIRGLGYQNWQFALKQLPLFIDELVDNPGQEHPDDLLLSLASAFNFLFEQLKIECELSPGNVERVHIDLFIEKIRKSLCVYRFKKQMGVVLGLAERTLKYLNDRHEFSEKKPVIDRAAELIEELSAAVIANTTTSLVAFEDKRESEKEKNDPMDIKRWGAGRLELKQERRYMQIGCAA